MKEKDVRVRTPTTSDVKSAYRKKLYRKRTMEEVGRRFSYTINDATDSSSENDPAKQTVDASIDTVRYAGDQVSETVRAYSRKLSDRPKGEDVKRSEALRTESVKVDPEKVQSTSKNIQKARIKKNYAKTAREAHQGAKTAGKNGAKAGKKAAEDTTSAVSAAMQKITEFIAEHPVETILGALVIIILLAFMCTLNSCGMIFGGVSGGSVSATYTAEDADIRGAEADYQAKEAALQTKMNNVESLYPGYDEYQTDFDSLGHNAWHLASVLTVIHQDFTRADVQGSLTSLFNAQYTFTVTAQSETRYRTERRTGYTLVYDYDEDGIAIGYHYEPYTYYVEVPYTYTILTAKMVNNGLDNVINNLGLSADDLELYEYLNQTKGEKDYLF